MSDHRTYEARFGALLDGDLEAQPRAEIEAHLAECAACAAAWSRYTASVGSLRCTNRPTPSAHVAAVMARVAAARASIAPTRRATATARAATDDDVTHVTSGAPTVARRRVAVQWRSLATHAVALAAGALVMFALAPLFGARVASPTASKATRAGTQSPDHDAVARLSAERAAAARSEAQRTVALALALQEAALARALVGRDAAEALAASELARARAAEATLAEAQRADTRRDAELEALQQADERLAAAAQQRADAHRIGAERAESQRAAAEALAAIALVRSFERVGVTLAQLDAELVARAGTNARLDAAHRDATEVTEGGSEPPHEAAPSTRDWRAIEVDDASLAATGRRAEHVTIRREGDRVALSTSGALDDIVDALLARLDDPDPAVRAAVELRLDDIADELGVEREQGARPRKSADEPWWRSDRGQVAALTISGAGDSREPWPAWWSRARSAVGR